MGRLRRRENLRPTPPQWAIDAGFVNLTFDNDLTDLSTIDLADTTNPGFDFYIHMAWPTLDTSSAPVATEWANYQSPNPAAYSIISDTNARSRSVLQQTGGINAPTGGDGTILATAAYNNNANGYNGKLFGPGGAFTCRFKVLGTTTNSSAGWWGLNIEVLNKNHPNHSRVHVEVDMMETGDTPPGNPHATTLCVNDGTIIAGGAQNNYSNTDPGADYYTYGFRWKTMAQNSGVGELNFYLNDVLSSRQTYVAGDALAVMDTHHYVFFVKSLSGHFINVDRMTCWA